MRSWSWSPLKRRFNPVGNATDKIIEILRETDHTRALVMLGCSFPNWSKQTVFVEQPVFVAILRAYLEASFSLWRSIFSFQTKTSIKKWKIWLKIEPALIWQVLWARWYEEYPITLLIRRIMDYDGGYWIFWQKRTIL